ncbi:MAG TPA: cell surface protein SprA, partial [Cytophagaceae bacterium]
MGASLSIFTFEPKASKEQKSSISIAPSDTIVKKERRTTRKKNVAKQDTSRYKPKDRYGDPLSNPDSKSPLILKNPSNITTDVELDSAMEEYTIKEQVGGVDYRPATTMTFEEYTQYKNREMMKNYYKSKSAGPLGERADNKKNVFKGLKIPVRGLEGPFGSNFVDIRPNGSVTLDFAGKWQRINNPQVPVRQQKNGGFDFDQQISMNVVGKIGEKLKLTANWDTKATFDFQNNVKLEYTGFEEDIIQKIEAGFVSMPINSSLISGSQNLFGIKTKLQFGRLSVTSVLSSQKGKVEEMRLQGGSQARDFEVKSSQYDENRHFFLGHFFRNNYEPSLDTLPTIQSGVKINRVEVWITNRVNSTVNTRNIIAYRDLGEADSAKAVLFNGNRNYDNPIYPIGYPANNNSNRLNEIGVFSPEFRNVELLPTKLTAEGLANGQDYYIINSARKLLPTDFKFNQELGYISLNSPISSQDLVAVAYEYTYNDKIWKVGDLTGDVPGGDTINSALVLKMLKPIGNKLNEPTWNLMMKNIYPLGSTQISRENFQLRILYRDDSTGADLPNLQEGARTKNRPLLRLFQLDRLNPNNDVPPDGNFDFIEDVTIDSRYGKVIFPVLEPFGSYLNGLFVPGEDALREKYVYQELYEVQKNLATQITLKDKFVLKGRYQASSSSDIQLPGLNIANGSV